jgi:hypothetical protein
MNQARVETRRCGATTGARAAADSEFSADISGRESNRPPVQTHRSRGRCSASPDVTAISPERRSTDTRLQRNCAATVTPLAPADCTSARHLGAGSLWRGFPIGGRFVSGSDARIRQQHRLAGNRGRSACCLDARRSVPHVAAPAVRAPAAGAQGRNCASASRQQPPLDPVAVRA